MTHNPHNFAETLARIDLDLARKGIVPRETVHWLDDPKNDQLKNALTIASQASKWIESEQGRLHELLAEAKTDTEREAREYQIWYVAKYLNRAQDIAVERLRYFRELKDFKVEQVKIKGDTAHWFKYYAWGYDPRARTPLSVVPFELFPKQQEFVEWINNLVFYRRASGIIEKSRDAVEFFGFAASSPASSLEGLYLKRPYLLKAFGA